MKKAILKNDFHKTEVSFLIPDDSTPMDEWSYLNFQIFYQKASDKEKRLYRKINKTLCGMQDCNCGTVY